MGRACLLRERPISEPLSTLFHSTSDDTLSQEHVILKTILKARSLKCQERGVSSLQCACSRQALHSFEILVNFWFKCVGLRRGIKYNWRKSSSQATYIARCRKLEDSFTQGIPMLENQNILKGGANISVTDWVTRISVPVYTPLDSLHIHRPKGLNLLRA